MIGLEALRRRPWLHVVGLMSGTSADGVDAALVRVSGHGPATVVETLASLTRSAEPAVRAATLGLATTSAAHLCRANLEIGERFAEAALAVIEAAGMTPQDVHLIGSHGQTVVHLPGREGVPAATLQLGEPSVIAERTGLPVVADFRMRDVAAGGAGAPLVPWVDWLLLRLQAGDGESASASARLVQNLGGVGNVTLVTPDHEDVVAFDTGPANGPLDAAASLVFGVPGAFDAGGEVAARGRADDALVEELLQHPFFALPPPKSLGRDEFGEAFVADVARRRPDLGGPDLLATLTEFVARSVVAAYRDHLPGERRPRDVIVSGGGVHNVTLMARLRSLLEPLPVRSSAELGVDPDSREAVAFAVLANEALHGAAANLPAVTGAARRVVLGKFVP